MVIETVFRFFSEINHGDLLFVCLEGTSAKMVRSKDYFFVSTSLLLLCNFCLNEDKQGDLIAWNY